MVLEIHRHGVSDKHAAEGFAYSISKGGDDIPFGNIISHPDYQMEMISQKRIREQISDPRTMVAMQTEKEQIVAIFEKQISPSVGPVIHVIIFARFEFQGQRL